MEGQRLILNDGTIIEGGRAGYADGFLWLYLTEITMMQAAQMFFDQDKTQRIEYQYGEMSDVYEGFTVCRSIISDAEGQISVCMVRG